MRFLELSPMVASFTVQPIKLELQVGDEIQRYFPDVHIDLADGSDLWCEVKPAARLAVARVAARLSAAHASLARDGSKFVVVTDTWLHQEPRRSNVAGLMYHRRAPIPPVEVKAVERQLHVAGPKVLADLEELLGKDLAWRLLGAGVVGLDLEKVIQADSQIFLTGGHRHADFFA
ncbi:MAG: TnsA endonuclease N-terminal domain-containing protein [Nitrospira sp.]|nr:TnsA endonuclease N-terminal domain-containing protein [Nitrospira sp.]